MAKRPIQSSIQAHASGEVSESARIGRELRQAMSLWPTGVAVLAVRHQGRTEALTANSLISASLDPPIVVVSIAQGAQILPLVNEAGHFTLSLLADDQARIASMVADRMPGLQRLFTDDEQPHVRESIAHLTCTTLQTVPAGDHTLYIAAVEHVQLGRDARPLLYFEGKYQRL